MPPTTDTPERTVEPEQDLPSVAPETTAVATPGEVAAVLDARDALADPATQLATVVVDIARRVDFLRHEVDRGSQMQDESQALSRMIEEAADAELDMEAVLQGLEDPPPDVATQTEALISTAQRIRSAAEDEVASLEELIDFDLRLTAVTEGWTRRGSRSESRVRLAELVTTAEGVLGEARGLRILPSACTGMRRNRIRWAAVVLERTMALAAVAERADGVAYDQLLDQIERAPYGEDPVAADAEVRGCWSNHSTLSGARSRIETRLSGLSRALGG